MRRVVFDGEFEFVQVDVRFLGSGTPAGEAAALIAESTGMVEFGARTLLARVVGRRLASRDPGSIGGLDVRQYRCKFSQRDFLDLAEWASARGWTVGEPDAVPTVTLAKDGRTILLPLAAMQAKVDGVWRELGDCVAEKDGRWLVPATIEELVR